MKGDEESGSESDIDDLLNALDTELSPKIPQDKSSTSRQGQLTKSNLKDSSKEKSSDNTTQFSSNQGQGSQAQSKSVRFSQEVSQSPLAENMSKPSTFLNNVFFPETEESGHKDLNNKKNPTQEKSKLNNQVTIQAATSQQQKGKKQSSSSSATDDWLGIGLGDGDDDSLKSAFQNTTPQSKAMSSGPAKKLTAFNALQRKMSDDFDFDSLGLSDAKTSIEGKTAAPASSSSIENRQNIEVTNPNARKPPIPLNSTNLRTLAAASAINNPTNIALSRTPSAEFQLGKIPGNKDRGNNSGSQLTGQNQTQDNEGDSAVSSLNILQNHGNVPQAASRGQYNPGNSAQTSQLQERLQKSQGQTPNFLDALPFLNQKAQGAGGVGGQESPMMTRVGDVGNQVAQHPGGPTGTGTTKKKVSKVAAPSGLAANTLQLPSHLVNEEELKTMSSSLKTLYANQIEMLENSYKEQLDFVASSSKRREDLLKEEMSNLQTDYEQRIQRLRAELKDNTAMFPEKVQQEIFNLTSNFDKLSSQFESLKDSKLHADVPKPEINYEEVKTVILTEVGKLMEIYMSKVTENIQTSLTGSIQHSFDDNISKNISVQFKALEELKSKFDTLIITNEQETEKVFTRFEEIEKSRLLEGENILRTQKKLKDNAVTSAVNSVTKILEDEHQETRRRKDRLAIQVKEFRKDLRRLYVELENKNDFVHKSQLSMEMEQRNITQSIRDINTILKLTTSKQAPNETINTAANQFAAMQAVQHQAQNEMEIKLLKDERNSLSESIAQMNVERRKLLDEKLYLEREKMEFEREKSRVREIEMQAKAKLVEAEEMKRNAELLRQQETKLSGEAELKLQEITKERSRMKDKVFEIEQKLVMREQKLFHDKSELMREKEFIDKLRDQLLCPGCLNSIKGVSTLLNLAPPPPYSSQTRSDGDGVELNFNQGLSSVIKMPKLNLTPEEDAYFRKETKYLDDLSTKYY